jgi:signal transduction histidine kinase
VGFAAGRDGTIFAFSPAHVYRAYPDGRVERIASVRGAIQAIDRSDGSTAIGCFAQGAGFVYELAGGVVREIDRFITRFMAVVERRGVLWIAYDTQLVRLDDGEPKEIFATSDGLTSGGSLLVDHEGSLWIGTMRGLLQLPEPDSMSWQSEAPVGGIQLLSDRGALWMSAWTSLLKLRANASTWVLDQLHGTVDAPCADRDGNVWSAGLRFPHPQVGAGMRRERRAELGWVLRCAPSPRGGVWLPATQGIFHVAAGADAPELWAATTAGAEPFRFIYEDTDGTLWAARGYEICSTTISASRANTTVHWSCADVPGTVQSVLRMPSGEIWAATLSAGVLRYRNSTWEPIPASHALASRSISSLRRSPRGGVWIIGEGNFFRVQERTDSPAGWDVVERIGAWHGLPTSGVADVVEDPDGTLWAATNMSLVRIAASARVTELEPPTVVLVDTTSDEQPLVRRAGQRLVLPHDRNRLELRFAALSFRDPSLIRYRTRLTAEEPWSAPTTRGLLRFVALAAGKYQVQVGASLDGIHWSATPAELVFEVLPAWYATLWFRILALLLVAALFLIGYRLRVASLLKQERQRMQIAIDLHDEVGSGLGSIGVLAGLLMRSDVPSTQRQEMAQRIGGVSRELSHSLGDIVWSLRAGSGSLESLWLKLLDRARSLFAAGDPELRASAPEPIPAVALSLTMRRNISLMAIEALHNAARHAEASVVTLRLDREGDDWLLEVADDGKGMPADPPAPLRRGLGLESMQARAKEVGASIEWDRSPAGGTRVQIRFRP